MSLIFISHSSKDNEVAAEVRAFLEEQGHQSVFLDFDPDDGIPAGRSWEKELYSQLRGCRAVIVLCSEHSMASDWCFAEITHAKSMGKHLFPVKIAPCELRAVITDSQVVDFAADRDEAFQRIGRGLLIAGLDPRNFFDWDGSRPPYPGLLAFKEEDAAIFFGREDAIQQGLDALNRLSSFGGSRVTLVLGASGSGKSSLLRAGLVPRLKRNTERWLVVGPFRLLTRPLRELAIAFGESFARHGAPRDWEAIHSRLVDAAEPRSPDGAALLELADALRTAAGRREATVLVVIDQVEEILGHASDGEECRFLHMLRAALDAPGSPMMVIGTLRSDFLGAFQNEVALRDLPFETLAVGPLSAAGFAQVIEGPAVVASLELEAGLVQAMVADTETDDALPLLAFTLSELWERYGADGRLTCDEYRDKLGGLEGSVARAAEAVMTAKRLSPEASEDLRHAFVSMVRINEEGQFARRPARWTDLPPGSHDLLERFVSARLLVSSSDERGELLEVAHESLFRAWRQLRAWLEEDRDRIRLKDGLRRAAEEWQAGGREAQLLVHRDGRLADAEAMAREPRFSLAEGSVEQAYLEACLDAQHAREHARRRRVRNTVGALAAAVCLFAVLAVWAVIERDAARRAEQEASDQRDIALLAQAEAERQRLTALSRQLAAQALNHVDDRFDLALLLSLEANRISDAVQIRGNLSEVLQSNPRLLDILRAHSGPVRSVAFSPDGRTLAAGGLDGQLTLWDVAARRQHGTPVLGHTAGVYGVAFSPDGRTLASGSEDSSVVLWDVADVARPAPRPAPLEGHTKRVHTVAFSPDGRLLASGSLDESIVVWNVDTGRQHGARLTAHEDLIKSVVFGPGGRTLASGDDGGHIIVWDVAKAEALVPKFKAHRHWIMGLALSPNGEILASASADRTVGLWDPRTGQRLDVLSPHPSMVTGVAFSPDGGVLAAATGAGSIVLWDVATREPRGRPLAGHAAAILSVAFSPDGRTLASGHDDGTVVLWDVLGRQRLGERLATLDGVVMGVDFSPDGNTLAVGAGGNTVALWDLETGEESRLPLPRREQLVRSVAFSPDGETLASGSEDKTIILWNVAERRQGKLLTGHRDKIFQVSFSPDGSVLASASKDGTLRLWDLSTGKERELAPRHGHFVMSVAFSPDGEWLASGSWDETARLWRLADASTTTRVAAKTGAVNAVTFSPDSKLLAVGGNSNKVVLWSVPRAEGIGDGLVGHAEDVLNVVFSPDGDTLASSDKAGSIILWDMQTREPLGEPLTGHTDRIHALAFSPDGSTLASGSHDKTVMVWDVGFDSWRARACRIAARNLTEAEWRRFIGADLPYQQTCGASPGS